MCIRDRLYPLCQNTVQIALVQTLNGLGFGTILGCAVNYAHELSPKGLETTVMTIYGAGMGISGIIASAFGGWAIGAMGVRWMYTVNGVVMMGLLALFVLSFVFGQKVLKKTPPLPLFARKRSENRPAE